MKAPTRRVHPAGGPLSRAYIQGPPNGGVKGACPCGLEGAGRGEPQRVHPPGRLNIGGRPGDLSQRSNRHGRRQVAVGGQACLHA
jgi:hypothetical protein